MTLLCIVLNVQAEEPVNDYILVIKGFIEGYINTDYKKMEKLVSRDVVEKLPREKSVLVNKYSEIIGLMKSNNMTKQDCTWEYKILAENEGLVIAQIDFNFETHTLREFITLERGAKSWLVTGINKFFMPVASNKVLSLN